MKISEEDIFKYVLFPDELEPETKEYIKKNEEAFAEQIEIVKDSSELSADFGISNQAKQAADRIYNKIFVVELHPVINKNISKDKTLNLAAANVEEINVQSESITYSDENSKYLVRIISNKEKNTLYFFSKDEDKEQKLKITLIPANEIIHISNNSQQIEIDRHFTIQKIQIEHE